MFANLANVDLTDEKSESANKWMRLHRPELPKLNEVDAVDGLIYDILEGKQGIHKERQVLPLSEVAILQYPYKLVQVSECHDITHLQPKCYIFSG